MIRLVLVFIILLPPTVSWASAEDETRQVIRDHEVEEVVKDISTPIFREAGLAPENVKIFIIGSDEINAFVSGGMNIFINTSTITLSNNPTLLRGVIAHEVGHITGGHLIRRSQEYERAFLGTIFSYVLGAATIVASGSPQVGTAIMSGANQVTDRLLLRYTRGQEESADQAAIKVLSKLGYSSEGLLEVLKKLDQQENISFQKNNSYSRTHPLSSERIDFVEEQIRKLKITDKESIEEKLRYTRIVAKIKAFLEHPSQTFKEYPEPDISFAANYARAIAYHKSANLSKSLEVLDSLLKTSARDPYLHELKGQILFENGKIEASVTSYQAASKILPDSALISLGLASSLISTNKKENIDKSITLLNKVTGKEPKNSIAWRQLATAYGKINNLGMANYALAEEAMILREDESVTKFTQLAKKLIKNQPQITLRLNDIETEYRRKKSEKN